MRGFIVVAAAMTLVASPITFNITEEDTVEILKTAQAAADGGGNGGGDTGGGGGRNAGGDGSVGGNGGGSAAGGSGVTDGNAAATDSSALLLKPTVAIAQFTTSISENLPIDEITSLGPPNQAIYFFTEIVGMNGRVATHRWYYGGAVQQEVPNRIDGDSGKFWSTQNLPQDMNGVWKVEVIDDLGAVLLTRTLNYKRAADGGTKDRSKTNVLASPTGPFSK